MGEPDDGGTDWAHVVSMLEEIDRSLEEVDDLDFIPDVEALTNAEVRISWLLKRARVMAKREAGGDG